MREARSSVSIPLCPLSGLSVLRRAGGVREPTSFPSAPSDEGAVRAAD
nr:MAG TPA: hypothetical protein [Caudoviricetes sp.]